MFHNEVTTLYRLKKPLLGFINDPVSGALISTLWTLIAGLTQVNPQYVVYVFLLIIVDFITGISRAWKEGREISSLGLRQTGIKIIEFVSLMLVMIWTANALTFEEGIPVIIKAAQYADDFTFAVIGFIEVKSIMENIGQEKIFKMLTKLVTGKFKELGELKDIADELDEEDS